MTISKRIAAAFCLIPLVILAEHASAGTTIDCGRTSNDQAAVQGAINVTSRGDTVRLRGVCEGVFLTTGYASLCGNNEFSDNTSDGAFGFLGAQIFMIKSVCGEAPTLTMNRNGLALHLFGNASMLADESVIHATQNRGMGIPTTVSCWPFREAKSMSPSTAAPVSTWAQVRRCD